MGLRPHALPLIVDHPPRRAALSPGTICWRRLR